MAKFETVTFDETVTLKKEGMEIKSYIAGVNSGAYQLPFVISVRCWSRKWIFEKFFFNQMNLNIHQVKKLRDECNKVIEAFDNKSK